MRLRNVTKVFFRDCLEHSVYHNIPVILGHFSSDIHCFEKDSLLHSSVIVQYVCLCKGVVDMVALCLLTAAVCLSDYFTRRIPNLILLIMMTIGILYRWQQMGAGGIPFCLFQTGIVILLFYPLFRIGALGAGDVKLFGVAAGYLPFQKVFLFVFISMLIAAIFSLIRLICDRQLRRRMGIFLGYVRLVAVKGALIPYPIERNGRDKICLSGPVLLCLILYLGGVW